MVVYYYYYVFNITILIILGRGTVYCDYYLMKYNNLLVISVIYHIAVCWRFYRGFTSKDIKNNSLLKNLCRCNDSFSRSNRHRYGNPRAPQKTSFPLPVMELYHYTPSKRHTQGSLFGGSLGDQTGLSLVSV